MRMPEIRKCDCGSGKIAEPQFDGYQIYLCSTCPKCYKEKMSKSRRGLAGVDQTGYTRVVTCTDFLYKCDRCGEERLWKSIGTTSLAATTATSQLNPKSGREGGE